MSPDRIFGANFAGRSVHRQKANTEPSTRKWLNAFNKRGYQVVVDLTQEPAFGIVAIARRVKAIVSYSLNFYVFNRKDAVPRRFSKVSQRLKDAVYV